jgi:uncharacterized membrane protein YeaQ/YmgE (transglycosylase-associated protein family)
MKKLSLVLIALLLVVVTGCKLMCTVVQPVAVKFSSVVVDKCVCANAEQVQKDILQVVNSALVCDAQTYSKEGVVMNIVCPIAGNLMTGWLAGKIPESWQCTNSLGCVNSVVSVAVAACEMIPFQPNN